MSIGYLKGLNTLRFLAAFFVIISHGQISLWKLGIVSEPYLAVFKRGLHAVEFFFVLSGFLISLLLISEIKKTGSVSIRHFYLRRIFRIWPLYFLILLIGFISLGCVIPKLLHQNVFEFNILSGVFLFIFFLPNLATSFYPTGFLYPLWSIGVEEQYYLFWAPFIKLFKNKLFLAIICFVILSHVWYIAVFKNILNISEGWQKFLLSQKFYAMSVGALFGYIYSNKKESLILKGPFYLLAQAITIGVLSYHYLIGFPWSEMLWFRFALSFLYAVLIVFTITPGSLLNLEIQPFTFLGIISYGLYMYHMLADYCLRFTATKINIRNFNPILYGLFYHICLLGLTILIATLSYKYFESYFLRLKSKYT